MVFKLTTICLIDSIVNTKETNNFMIIEANTIVRVEKTIITQMALSIFT